VQSMCGRDGLMGARGTRVRCAKSSRHFGLVFDRATRARGLFCNGCMPACACRFLKLTPPHVAALASALEDRGRSLLPAPAPSCSQRQPRPIVDEASSRASSALASRASLMSRLGVSLRPSSCSVPLWSLGSTDTQPLDGFSGWPQRTLQTLSYWLWD
jgi:hypothetical protein